MFSELDSRLLSIYLNDHLAAATGGTELAKRAAAGNKGSAYGEFLGKLASEIGEDRVKLRRLMAGLGVREDKLKVGAGWTGEKFGRLKLNGRLRGYSPLSRVVELEALRLGVTAKLELWRTLRQTLGDKSHGIDLEALEKRAQAQLRGIASRHKKATAEAFAGETAG
jgi:hypothetical protein